MTSKRSYTNSYSTVLGILCVLVVYMHAGWIGGFDIYTLGTDIEWLRPIMGLLLMSVVPAFFMIWGYLSNKYLSTACESRFSLIAKIIQFYPLYLLVFLLNFFLHPEKLVYFSSSELIGGVLGVYYTSGFYGGNIFLVVLFALLTLSVLRKTNVHKKNELLIFVLCCLAIAKTLPHESGNCYIRYFGYYTSFFSGLLLKEYDFFERKKLTKTDQFKLLCVSLFVPILNLNGIKYLEIQYSPNSPEHLLFVVAFLFFLKQGVSFLRNQKRMFLIISFFDKIGNAAYFHFMIHAVILHGIAFVSIYALHNKILVQWTATFFTSFLTVFLIYPLYMKTIMLLKFLLKNSFSVISQK